MSKFHLYQSTKKKKYRGCSILKSPETKQDVSLGHASPKVGHDQDQNDLLYDYYSIWGYRYFLYLCLFRNAYHFSLFSGVVVL